MIGTVAEWDGDRLTVHEGTQNSGALRFGLAKALKIDPDAIEVRSRFLGGGFGQKNSLQPHTALVAIAVKGGPVVSIIGDVSVGRSSWSCPARSCSPTPASARRPATGCGWARSATAR